MISGDCPPAKWSGQAVCAAYTSVAEIKRDSARKAAGPAFIDPPGYREVSEVWNDPGRHYEKPSLIRGCIPMKKPNRSSIYWAVSQVFKVIY
jgi:hypothetical protein